MSDNQRVPILVYHHVYRDGVPDLKFVGDGAGIIGEEEFRRQIQYVFDNGWTVVSTSQAADWLLGEGDLPERSAVLHFDNGWLDTIEVAFPILEDLGITGTCFPITDGIEASSRGGTAAVRTLTEGVVSKPFMTWGQLQQLLDAGWEIGGHTATHCKVADKHESEGDAGVIEEVRTSNELFEQHLGLTPVHFAYPSGSRNDSTDRVLAEFYQTLRLWHVEHPIEWSFTDRSTSPLAIDCQNVDLKVPFREFTRIFEEAGIP
jgi:peptidoglycan/xylan/chitin deacetylase (PgdA/CDA1 family)